MLFVTGPFRGREVDTWHKLTSLFWMSGTHLFTPSSRLDLLEHESMSVEKKKKKPPHNEQTNNNNKNTHTTEPGKVLHQGEMLQEPEQLLLLGVALRNSEAELNSKVRTESKK